MLTIAYIRAIGDLIRQRLWARCYFGTLDNLRGIWGDYIEGKIDSAEYHQLAADCLNFCHKVPVPLA
jgi:hypothetical protein